MLAFTFTWLVAVTLTLVFFPQLVSLYLSSSLQQALGQMPSSGLVKQAIVEKEVLLYIPEVNVSTSVLTQKVVTIPVIIKNLDTDPHSFGFSLFTWVDVKLKDTDGRQYSKDNDLSIIPSIPIPHNDTVKGSLIFKMPQGSSNPGKLYYTKGLGLQVTNIAVNLTTSKSPPDQSPKSDWTLTPLKGFKGNDGLIGLTVNDERYENGNYILDITLKNNGGKSIHLSQDFAHLKDNQGNFFSRDNDVQNLISPLPTTDLDPADQLRGEIAFKVNHKPNNNLMFIWYSDDGYINSGNLVSGNKNNELLNADKNNKTTAITTNQTD